MKKLNLLLALALTGSVVFAQKKVTTSAIINFDATTNLDPLPKADNKTVIGALDVSSGTVAFEAIIKNFHFSNPRMQDHFNGKGWMDSEQYPNATFSGKIKDLTAVNFSKNGTYTVMVEGDLNMHGKTKKITTPATIQVRDGVIETKAEFIVKLEDFDINGPAVGAGKVATDPKIMVEATFN